MIHLIYLFLPLTIALSVAGCGHGAIPNEQRAFENTQIVFPDSLVSIENGMIADRALPTTYSSFFIIYHSRQECSSCLVVQLYNDLSTLQDISARNCAVLVIFAPLEDEVQEIIQNIVDLKYPFPIYVDLYDHFGTLNPELPNDTRFHAFLLNEKRKPICVGDPMASEGIRNVLYKVLDSL